MIRLIDKGEALVLNKYFGNVAKDTTMRLILFTNLFSAIVDDFLYYEDFTQPPASCGYAMKTLTMSDGPVITADTWAIPTARWDDQTFTFTGPIPIVAVALPGIKWIGTASVIGYALCSGTYPYDPIFWECLTNTNNTVETIFTFTPLANSDSVTVSMLLQLGNGTPT